MANSELYLIFPAYEDAQGKPHYIKTVGLLSEEDYVVFLSNIESLILFFELENYEGYYDGTNIQAFLLPLDTVEEYYPNIKTRFRRIMSDWGENWRKQSVQAEDDNYQYFSTEITNDTLCELTKRIKDSTDENTYLLINQDAFSCSESMIRTKCNDIVYEIDVRTIGVKNIANWFETNRVPQRI